MKIKINDRKLKFGGVSLAITTLVIAAVIILNVAFTALAYKFSIYTPMGRDSTYEVTDNCISYVQDTVIPKIAEGESITIYFCNDEDIIRADKTQSQILTSASEIAKEFQEKINIDFLNVWENPKLARKYGITSSNDVAIVYGERYHVIARTDFFNYNETTGEATAYNGEKRLAAGLLKVARESNPMCYITVNHGELIESYELLYMLADAGYNYNYLDLLNYDIPEDCDLLLTFDPRQDLAKKDSVSGISEVEKIEKYMQDGGSLWFFASADTFLAGPLDNFESLLEKYGVKFSHSENSDGIEECLQIKDSSNSTSIDGYTFFTKNAENDVAKNWLSHVKAQSLVGNATAIDVSHDFTKQPDGSFASANGKITLAPILVSHAGAQGLAGGRIIRKATDDEPFNLMTVSVFECENGKSATLLACSSTVFASESTMQSAVYGNSMVLSAISKHTGNEDAPILLMPKPFPTTEMSKLTTKNATIITIVSAAAPTLAIAIAGAVILIRRKNRI